MPRYLTEVKLKKISSCAILLAGATRTLDYYMCSNTPVLARIRTAIFLSDYYTRVNHWCGARISALARSRMRPVLSVVLIGSKEFQRGARDAAGELVNFPPQA